MIKVYIAAPFFSAEQLEFVEAIERQLNLNNIDYFSPRLDGTLSDMELDERLSAKKRIFEGNVKAMDMCTVMLAVIDGKDTGTMWEMGYAYGTGLPVISITDNDYGINIMLAESVRAHIKDTSQIMKALTDVKFTGDLVEDVC